MSELSGRNEKDTLLNFCDTLEFTNPYFYEVAEDYVIVESQEGDYTMNPVTGKVYASVHITKPQEPTFMVKGAVVICLDIFTLEGWGFSPCQLFKTIGKLKIWQILQFGSCPDSLRIEAIKKICFRANDLNVGDNFDLSRGHSSFSGSGVIDACAIISEALQDNVALIRRLSACALFELYKHAGKACYTGKGCYKKSHRNCLYKMIDNLKTALKKESTEDVREAMKAAVEEFAKHQHFLRSRSGR